MAARSSTASRRRTASSDPVASNAKRFELTAKQQEAHELLAGPQTHTLLVGGARSGKTFELVNAIVIRAARVEASRHAIVRYRYNAVRASVWLDTYPKVMSLCFPGVRYRDYRQDGFSELSNGSQIWFGGLDEKERVEKILGQEYATIFANECSQIPYSSIVVLRTRLAQKVDGLPLRGYYDLNPTGTSHWTNRLFVEKRDPRTLKPIPDPERYAYLFMNPRDNAQNLPAGYIESELETLPERSKNRFLKGIYQPEVEGALWNFESIERSRCAPDDVPQMRRIVVAIDPSGAGNKDAEKKSDDIGIVVAGLGFDGRVYLIEDLTVNGPPEMWGRRAVAAWYRHKADRIVAETNFGGDMVAYVIRSIDAQVPVVVVTASRGKAIRAEPVSVLYEEKQDKVRHAGRFTELEDQLLNFSTVGYEGERSPDRADAWIWAVTDLVISSTADGWIEFYRRVVVNAQNAPPAAEPNVNRPWSSSAPSDSQGGGDLMDVYKAALADMQPKPQTCKRCGKPLGASRVSDGVDAWHPECRI